MGQPTSSKKTNSEDDDPAAIADEFIELLPFIIATQVESLREERQKKAAQFLSDNEKRFNEIDGEIAQNLFHLAKLRLLTHSTLNSFADIESLTLIDRAIKLSFACTDFTRQLRFYESMVLSRSLIELCSTAIAIKKDTRQLIEFQKRNYKSSQAIKVAKKYFPEIAPLWVDISKKMIHINAGMHGAKKSMVDDGVVIETTLTILDIDIPDAKGSEILLDYLHLMNYLIQTTIELLYFKRITYLDHEWFQYPDHKNIFSGEKGIDLFSMIFKKLQNAALKK